MKNTTSSTALTLQDTLLAMVVVLIWGVNFVPMKFGLQALTPFELGAGRYLFVVFPLVFFLRFPQVRVRWVIAVALFQCVGQFSLLFLSLQVGMPASLASVLLQTQVFFTALWSFLIFKNRPNLLLWLSMGAAAIGLGFFVINALQHSDTGNITLSGLLFILASAAMWGASNLAARQAQIESPNYNALSFIVWSGVIAVPMYVLLMAIFDTNSLRWLSLSTWTALSLRTWLSVIFIGWFSTLIGYALWTMLLKRHPVNRVAPFSLGVPVIGVTIGMLWLKEQINLWQWLGSAFIGVALLLVVFGPRFFKSLSS